jgi:hypothetical protein
MKYRSIKIGLVSVALFGGVASASDLPDCPSSKNAYRHNCFGTFIHGPKSEWAGDIYQGEYLNGQASGQGTYIWKNGDKYVGEWKSDRRNGKGTFTYGPKSDRAGTIYIGDFKNGRANGKGKAIALDGSTYEGEVKDSERSGQGTFISAEGVVQHGIWKNDKFQYAKKPTKPAPVAKIATRTGVDSSLPDCPSDMNLLRHNCFGTYTYRGNIYVGEWRDGTYGGQGTFTYNPNGEHAGMRYTGEWKVGKWNGQGTLTHQDGSVSKGIWKDDKFQYTKTPPYNSAISSAPKTTNLCNFNNARGCGNNALCHLAVTTLNSGQKLWTSFNSIHVLEAKKRGLSCGVESISSTEVARASDLPDCSNSLVRHNCFGKMTFEDGAIYVGEWKNSKYHGDGIYTEVNGFKYVGEFRDDKWNGYGTATTGDGDTFIGMWKDNLAVKGKIIYANGDIYVGKIDKKGNAIGEGTYVYANGDKYVGEWRTDKKNGQGTLVFASGAKYVGDWKDNKRTGQGVYTSASGSIYKGEYKDNKWSGQGTLTYGPKSKWAGDKYVGGWKNDKRNGKGKYTYADGTIKEGIWEDGKLQGLKTASAEPNTVSNLPDCPSGKSARWHNCFGNHTYANGNKYVGEWKDNQKTGQGIFTWKSGNIYVGEFKDNKNNGQGVLTFVSGNKYVGEFKDNKNNGQGVLTYVNGDKYVGEFKDSSFYGQGTYTYKSGQVEEGTWKDGKLNGQATVTFVNGNKYVGEFKDDKRTKGTYTFASGDKYVGGWRNGKRHGQGTYTFADGKVRDGTWKDGEFEYAKTPTKPVPVVKAPTQDDQAIPASSGSGFAVSSDGYVITNSHVIDGCQDVFIHTPEKDVKMRVISNDPKNDLALLKGNFTPLAVFSLSTKSPEITQDIFVAGYPFGYRVSSSVKVTKGIISSLTGIGNDFSNFQMDAALQSGNSGGPVLDDMGNVVGVAVAKLDAMKMLKDTGSIPENTNFGIKANVVKSVLDSSSVDVPSENKSVISTSQRAKLITDGTYYISCWMTLAQIEKVRSKKVLFSELD